MDKFQTNMDLNKNLTILNIEIISMFLKIKLINLNHSVKCSTSALSLGLILATQSVPALAITNDDIVDAISPSTAYLRNGFKLQDGTIKELKSVKMGESLKYCSPVSVRSKPDINSKKIAGINDGNFEEYVIKKGPNFGWANIFKGGKFIGYSAQAISDGGKVTNIVCPSSNWITQSIIKLDGAEFNAELIDQRELTIKDVKGEVVYNRKVSGKTSLYEVRNSSGLFGWIVGWDKYDDSPYYNDIDFTVARVVIPYVDSDGDQKVWDAVYEGVQNSKFLDIISEGKDKITIVSGKAIWGPKFYMCSACTRYWGLPAFVTIERSKGFIKESIKNGEIDFQSVSDLPPADRFLYNWLYWNPERLGALLAGPIANQIKSITSRCSPSKLAFYKRSFIPQWEWTPSLHYDQGGGLNHSFVLEDQAKKLLTVTEFKKYYEDANSSYEALLSYIWDSSEFSPPIGETWKKWNNFGNITANGSEYFYDLRECVNDNINDKQLVTAIVGWLNMPLDIDLLEAVIGQRQ